MSWHHISDLIFYNDENNNIKPPPKPRKPYRSKYKSDKQYNERVVEWQAHLPHDADVQLKGNSMTQQYYTERLFPLYIKEIQRQRIYYNRDGIL